MSDDILTDDLVRYQILSKVTPGKIIVVNEMGHWDITEPSRAKSAMRSVWNLMTAFRFPPSQRSIFLTHLERTTKSLISHCDLQMQTRVFDVCLKQPQSATVQDIEKFDQIMSKLKTICKTLVEGMKGLEMLCKTTPYQTDVNFSGEIDIRLMYQVKCFFQRVANAVGPQFSKSILEDATTWISKDVRMTSPSDGNGNGNGNGSQSNINKEPSKEITSKETKEITASLKTDVKESKEITPSLLHSKEIKPISLSHSQMLPPIPTTTTTTTSTATSKAIPLKSLSFAKDRETKEGK